MGNKKEKIIYTKEFLEKVKNRDNTATELLYEDLKDTVYKRVIDILKNHHDAEDIVMESLEKAIEKLDSLKNPSDFPSWLGRIAENTAKNFLKRSRTVYLEDSVLDSATDELNDKGVNPVEFAESNENIELYKKLIGKLSEEQRTVLILNRIEGYKYKEIAEILGCAESTVKYRVRQGKKNLTKEAEKLRKKGYTLNESVKFSAAHKILYK